MQCSKYSIWGKGLNLVILIFYVLHSSLTIYILLIFSIPIRKHAISIRVENSVAPDQLVHEKPADPDLQ